MPAVGEAVFVPCCPSWKSILKVAARPTRWWPRHSCVAPVGHRRSILPKRMPGRDLQRNRSLSKPHQPCVPSALRRWMPMWMACVQGACLAFDFRGEYRLPGARRPWSAALACCPRRVLPAVGKPVSRYRRSVHLGLCRSRFRQWLGSPHPLCLDPEFAAEMGGEQQRTLFDGDRLAEF